MGLWEKILVNVLFLKIVVFSTRRKIRLRWFNSQKYEGSEKTTAVFQRIQRLRWFNSQKYEDPEETTVVFHKKKLTFGQ